MTRRAYLYFVIIFIAGLVIGGAGTYYYAWQAHLWRHPWNENAEIRRMAHRLTLTPGQVRQLRPIIDDAAKQWSQIQGQIKPQLETLRQQTDGKIRQILDPAQQRKFAALVRKHEKHAKDH
ncbi:MAG: hypothetical protein ACRD22_17295 [Terriglobia bacterium]